MTSNVLTSALVNPLVAIGDETGSIRLVESDKDQAPGFEKSYVELPSHDNAIFDISISKDDGLMATACGDQKIRVMDIRSQTVLNILDGHISSVKQVAFEPDSSSILASCSRDGTAMIWDLRANVRGRSFDEPSISCHRPVEIVRHAHVQLSGPRGRGPKSVVSVTALAWAIPNTFLTACESRAELRCWDRRSIKHDRRGFSKPLTVSGEPKHHDVRPFGINSISVSPDKKMAYTLCKDSIVYAWGNRLLQHGPLHAYHHPELHASSFYVKSDVSPDGQYLATGSSSGSACVFPTAKEYFDERLFAQKTDYPEGSRIQTVAKNIRVGTGVVLVRAHDREVTDVSWTCKGDLVTIADDYHARCWRMDDQGVNAQDMRENGEENGRRWGWGWAQLNETKGKKEVEPSDENSLSPAGEFHPDGGESSVSHSAR
ncbi:WD40 repeat-like protein [Choiromyces venosus 120613-1]|uniref:WD40 repeat-like protein n=1 Tax=Choiromyces venosus 120613-1 TaxID=1336337 RepID=A0A3N4JA96_9PEZI|nr:WD40 repeat-like protein [Choiromyces venosus 120613-1]